MVERTTVFVKGKVYWAKLFVPVDNYEGTGKEWTYEFEPEDTSFLKEHRLLDRLKDKNAVGGRGEYLQLKKPEKNKEGEKNEPIRIYTEDNEPWDGSPLGNGTEVDVKLQICKWGPGKKPSIYTTAIRVTKHIPYVSNEFAGMDAGAVAQKQEAAAQKKASKPAKEKTELDDLDDDIPF